MQNDHLATKEDVQFSTQRGVINGWFFQPQDTTNNTSPCIVMAHGYGATRHMGLENYARVFASNGFCVLVFDYSELSTNPDRDFQHVNPFHQLEDYRDAITYVCSRAEVDKNKIGIWGSSFSGGHALVTSATDKRVKCVVSQVPTIDGYESFMRRKTEEEAAQLDQEFAEERLSLYAGNTPRTRTLVSTNIEDDPVYSNPAAVEWYTSFAANNPNWKNKITVESMELFRAYKPGSYIDNISPCPLLIIVAEDDVVTPADLAFEAFEKAAEPKKIVTLPGGHFEPYNVYFEQASSAACDWFKQHLL